MAFAMRGSSWEEDCRGLIESHQSKTSSSAFKPRICPRDWELKFNRITSFSRRTIRRRKAGSCTLRTIRPGAISGQFNQGSQSDLAIKWAQSKSHFRVLGEN